MSNDQNDSQSDPIGNTAPGRSGPGDSLAGESLGGHSLTGHLGAGTLTTMGVVSESLQQALSATTSDATTRPSSPPLETALEFRVVRPGAPVRRLRLTGNRYTFGSGDGCSIQLDDPTLRPMHAVLLRDAHRILMRAYSVPLDCNGTRVTEAVLRMGDIIRMGNYRFELLSSPSITESVSKQFAPVAGTNDGKLKDRLTELSQQWHARHAECEVRERRCDQRESELHGRETELWSRAENLQQRENLLMAQEAAAREIQATYAATQEELKSLRQRENQASDELIEKEAQLERQSAELKERQADLERRQAEWKEREQQYAERASDAQRQLEQNQLQAEAASEAVTRMREEFAALGGQLSELRERHSELQAREKREQEEHERLRAELEASRDAAVEAFAESEAQRQAGEAKQQQTRDELERVNQDLDSTRGELSKLREDSRACQEELNHRLQSTSQELQAAREDAERSRREIEEDHAYAQNRLAELEEQLAKSQENRLDSDSAVQAEIAELLRKQQAAELARQEAEAGRADAEHLADELRDNIRQLQETVDEANAQASQLREEATLLRANNDGAKASIRQLELLVDQTQNNQSAQQDSWEHESAQLQKTIEDLSVQLAAANAELGQLREANDALTQELAEADSAAIDEEAVIDSERFQILERELQSAREEIERLQSSHAETVARLETERQESESALRNEIDQLRGEIAAAHQVAEERIREFTETEAQLAEFGNAESEPADSQPAAAELDGSSDAFAADGQFSDEQLAEEQLADEQVDSSSSSEALETASSINLVSEPIVESGDQIWRLESGPAAANEGDTSSDVDVEVTAQLETDQLESEQLETGPAESAFESDSWSTSAETDGLQEPTSDEQAGPQQREDVSWHDEAPEQAVSDVIDDIEHNLQEAIDEYEPPAESPWGSSESDAPALSDASELTAASETTEDPGLTNDHLSDSEFVDQFATGLKTDEDHPLDWSAYMPGESQAAISSDETSSNEEQAAAPSDEWDPTAEDFEATDQVETTAHVEEAEQASDWETSSWATGPDAQADTLTETQPESLTGAVDQTSELEAPQTESFYDQSLQETESEDSGFHAPESIEPGSVEPESHGSEIHEPEFHTPEIDVNDASSPEASQAYGATQPWSGLQEEIDNTGVESAGHADQQDFVGQHELADQVVEQDEHAELDEHLDAEFDAGPEDVSLSDQDSNEDIGFTEERSGSTGSLAEMLIRDLSEEQGPADRSAESVSDESESVIEPSDESLSDEEDHGDTIDPTFVIENEINFADDDQDNSLDGWNLESPADAPEAQTDEESFDEPDVSQTAVAPESETVVAPEEPAEDDSIEAYMSRLLERVQGGVPTGPVVEEPVEESEPETDEPAVAESTEEASQEEIAETAAVEEPLKDSVPLVPRSQAPELSRNLSAMRELANQSARNAVARSIRVQARDTQMKAAFKGLFALAFAAMAVGVFLFISWSMTIKFAMIGAFLVLAGVFGQEGYVLARDARRRLALAEASTDETKDDAEIAEEIQRIAAEAQEG